MSDSAPRVVAFDLETHLFRPGVVTPRIVCLSYAGLDETPGLMLREDAVPFVHSLLDDDWEFVTQNGRFDISCLCVEDWSLFPKFVQAYEEARVHDVGIRDTLYYLGTQGLYSEDEVDDSSTKKPKKRALNFALSDMVKRRFHVDISEDKAKTKDKIQVDGSTVSEVVGDVESWRLRYRELDGVPLEQWPERASKYAMDDSAWTIKVYKDQGLAPIVNEDMQTCAAFWLQLMAVYGIRTDPERVVLLEKQLRKEFRIQNAILEEAGLLKKKKLPKRRGSPTDTPTQWGLSKDMRELRRAVALAYGGEKALADLENIYRSQDRLSTKKRAQKSAQTKAESARRNAPKKALQALNKLRKKEKLPKQEMEEFLLTWVAPEAPPEIVLDATEEGDGEDEGVKVVNGVPMTDKGQVATDRDTLQKLVHPKAAEKVKEVLLEIVSEDTNVPVPSAKEICELAAALFGLDHNVFYREFVLHEMGDRSGVEKLLTTFIPVLLQGTQVPIQPRWNVLVATGRTSCSKPNLQQLPRKGGVRECFVPRPGRVFIGADYNFVELCTLAEICYTLFGFSKLGDAINAGLDPHLDFAASIMGISYEEAERRMAADDYEMAEMRQASKAADFGYPGGLGADSFREYARATYKVVMTRERAIELKGQFYTKWPEVEKYHRHIGKMSDLSNEFTITQLYSGRKRAGCTYTSGANSGFQGLAADGAKLAGWLLMKEMYLENPHFMPRPERVIAPIREATKILDLNGQKSPLYGSRSAVFAHDEMIAESLEEQAPEAADRLARVMIECMQIYTPHVRIRSEPTITRRWLKGAKPIRDENGRLLVFEPKVKK